MTYKRYLIVTALFVLLVSGVLGNMIKVNAASDFETKYQAFISDARWKNAIGWGGNQGPKISGWDSSGCCAYAADFQKYVYGTQGWSKSTFYNVSEIKAGDILHIQCDQGEHWIVILNRNGNTLYTAEGNFGSIVVVSNSRYTISGNNLYNTYAKRNYNLTTGYHFNTGEVPAPTPTTSRRIYANSITSSNAVLHWDLDDTPYMGSVGVWIAKANEAYAGKWVEFTPNSNTNKVSVNVNTECGRTLEANTTYKYKFYYYVQNNCTWSDEGTFTTALGSSTSTTSRIIYVDNITETNALIHWDLNDTPYMGTVGIWVAKANEVYNGKWVEFAPYSKTNKVSVDVNAECGRSLEKGTKYKYVFYYYVGSNCTWSNEGTFVTKGDSTNPVVTDAEVINLDSNGYTVRCRATDNVGIDRVQCPTWTTNNGQDDLANDWGRNTSVKATHIGNNVYEFKVKRSDHNNEYGIYNTHIYAYDVAGNSVCVKLNNNNVQKEHIHAYTSEVTKNPTCTETGVRTFTCSCGDSYTESIKSEGHEYKSETIAPTATERGYTLYKCSKCEHSYKDNFVPATGVNNEESSKKQSEQNPTITVLEKDVEPATTQPSTVEPSSEQPAQDQPIVASENNTLSRIIVNKVRSTEDKITFEWDSDSNATGFVIEYSTNLDLSGAKQELCKRNIWGQYILQGLEANTIYYYRIRSFKGDEGEREYSEWTRVVGTKTQKKVTAPNISLKSVKNNKKKGITIKWKYKSAARGYQIYVAKNKNFVGAKIIKVLGYEDSTIVKGLKKGKTYYVKIRSFRNNTNGDVVYGKWSSVKKVKIKK